MPTMKVERVCRVTTEQWQKHAPMHVPLATGVVMAGVFVSDDVRYAQGEGFIVRPIDGVGWDVHYRVEP